MVASPQRARAPDLSASRESARDLLLEAASALMCDRDSLDVSLSEIAVRAECNSAMVKYYFGNKLGLMVALLDRDLSAGILQLQGLLEMDLSPIRKMRAHISGLVRLYFQFPYLQRLMMAIIRDSSEQVAQEISDRYLKPISDAYERLISEGVAAGQFKPTEPKLFYFAICGACDQIFSARYVLKYVHGDNEVDDDLRRRYAQQTISLLMEGLEA